MERFALALVLFCLGMTVPATAQTSASPQSAATGSAVSLTDQQKQAAIDAAVSAQSRQKTPKEFSPTIGAIVPKEVYLHAFRPDVAQKTPLLKNYWYAYLDREVILVDGHKVAAVIALPEKLIAGEQPNQGAAEASSTTGKGSTASVPSHTSPESIK
jgi:hypothetical protein